MNNYQPMLLWLPTSIECDDEFLYHSNRITQANDAILDFLEGELTLAQMLEIIDDRGADVDDYLKSLDSNLRQFGA